MIHTTVTAKEMLVTYEHNLIFFQNLFPYSYILVIIPTVGFILCTSGAYSF